MVVERTIAIKYVAMFQTAICRCTPMCFVYAIMLSVKYALPAFFLKDGDGRELNEQIPHLSHPMI